MDTQREQGSHAQATGSKTSLRCTELKVFSGTDHFWVDTADTMANYVFEWIQAAAAH